MKYLKILIIFLLANISFSQSAGITIVTYKLIKASQNNKVNLYSPDLLEFELLFNKNKAIFKLVDKLDTDNSKNYKIVSIFYGGNLTFYTDLNSNEKLYNVNYTRISHNVILPSENLKWSITNETKIIENYKCYKATAYFEKYDKGKNKMYKYYPEVWFTSEIPTSFGIKNLSGLPGLILEGTIDGKISYVVTKINKTVKNRTIERPKADVDINEKDFDELIYNDYITIKALD